MRVEVLYCHMCGGIDEAQAVVDELKNRMQIEATLVDAGRGRFEVHVDGKPIFTKAKAGRYPKPGELVALLRKGSQ